MQKAPVRSARHATGVRRTHAVCRERARRTPVRRVRARRAHACGAWTYSAQCKRCVRLPGLSAPAGFTCARFACARFAYVCMRNVRMLRVRVHAQWAHERCTAHVGCARASKS
eukprot:6190771-Pleurochrysis_carterae.AAC.1